MLSATQRHMQQQDRSTNMRTRGNRTARSTAVHFRVYAAGPPATTSPSMARFMSMRPLTRMSCPTDSDPTQHSKELKRLTLRSSGAGQQQGSRRNWRRLCGQHHEGNTIEAITAGGFTVLRRSQSTPAAHPPECPLVVAPRLDAGCDVAHQAVLLIHPLPLGLPPRLAPYSGGVG